MATKKTLQFYSDAGHGWLAVKRHELITLGIIDKITSCSYQRGATVYLEEDCDMEAYVHAMTSRGFKFILGIGQAMFDGTPANELIHIVTKNCERSPIRSYESFVS